jgi:ATP-binding cassette subfamily B protein
LLKYFDISSGEILIDGQNISNFNANSIRRQVSLIPQDIMLFHRTIAENICYSVAEDNIEAMIAAAKIAKIHQTIEHLPQKYNTIIGEKGFRLSGGQRQRIAIARAILKNAPILIFDEATSALDSETELEIQNSINELLANKNFTVIAVAHRLSTLKHMDRIIVLDQGRIIQEGSFKELIADSEGYFKKLWIAQAGDF